MAESHVVAALIAKRAELAGLIEHHRKEMGRLADDLAHLDATLKQKKAKSRRRRGSRPRPGAAAP